MRKQRVLSCVLLACFISCITLGSASASGTLIDDLPIDPWGDLEDVENYEPPVPTDPVFSDPYESPEVIPDENSGRVALFSLNDDNNSRTIYFNTSFKVGNSSTNGLVTYASGSRTFTYDPDSTTYFYRPDLTYQSASVSSTGVRLIMSKGTYAEISANVYYSPDKVQNIIVAGGGTFYMVGINGYNDQTSAAYPATAQLVVNGELVGEAVEMSKGIFSFTAVKIPVTEEITSLGYRFTYTSAVNNINTSASSAKSYNYRICFEDNALFTIEEAEEEPAYNGLLDTIIGWLRNIWDGIKNIGQSILDGLKGLFVPDEEDITEIKEMYSALLEERLGFVYEAFVMLDDAFTDLKDAFTTGNDYTFTFPGIAFPMNGEMITVVEEQEISMDNKFMDTVRPLFGTIVCLFSVAGVVRTSSDMVVAIISGVSPFAFAQKRDEIWETLWGEDS